MTLNTNSLNVSIRQTGSQAIQGFNSLRTQIVFIEVKQSFS